MTPAVIPKKGRGIPKPAYLEDDTNFVRIETDGTITFNPRFGIHLVFLNIESPYAIAQC